MKTPHWPTALQTSQSYSGMLWILRVFRRQNITSRGNSIIPITQPCVGPARACGQGVARLAELLNQSGFKLKLFFREHLTDIKSRAVRPCDSCSSNVCLTLLRFQLENAAI
jgi:hypothetical protein